MIKLGPDRKNRRPWGLDQDEGQLVHRGPWAALIAPFFCAFYFSLETLLSISIFFDRAELEIKHEETIGKVIYLVTYFNG